ncbi:MAG TPA: SDR family NAD(P)-dependent oxidoreductase [Candidatus Limnocylindria bacterium]|nr:SDR family NAD(P)-dependent oxidoreductase [Candidatus Limnocylindria bacterium]
MDVRKLDGKTALVTGAGSGIGRATALALAARGARLVVCDVNEAGLTETADAIRRLGRDVLARRVDVARADEMRAFAEAVHTQIEAVDILMNNAGVGLGGGFLHTTLDDWNWIIGINLLGVIHGCHFFLPAMVGRRRGGHVVNVASAAGYVATEALAAYATTKFAVVGLSEALRDELGPHGIGVTAVCPGLINTPITQTSPLRGPEATPEARAYMIEVYQRRNYPAERVAEGVLRAIQRNRAVAPISPEAWGMYLLKRFAPGLLTRLNRTLAARARREVERRRTRA